MSLNYTTYTQTQLNPPTQPTNPHTAHQLSSQPNPPAQPTTQPVNPARPSPTQPTWVVPSGSGWVHLNNFQTRPGPARMARGPSSTQPTTRVGPIFIGSVGPAHFTPLFDKM